MNKSVGAFESCDTIMENRKATLAARGEDILASMGRESVDMDEYFAVVRKVLEVRQRMRGGENEEEVAAAKAILASAGQGGEPAEVPILRNAYPRL